MKVLIGKHLLEELRIQSDTSMGDEPHHIDVRKRVNDNPYDQRAQQVEVSGHLVETVFDIENYVYGDPLSRVDRKLWKDVKQFYVDVGYVRVADPNKYSNVNGREVNEVQDRTFTHKGIHYIGGNYHRFARENFND